MQQLQGSAIVVNGVTLVPGGPGSTIDGELVSLESGDGETLDVGSGKFAMPTWTGNASVGLQSFVGGQGGREGVSLFMIMSVAVSHLLRYYY